jgi:hypothetical protein
MSSNISIPDNSQVFTIQSQPTNIITLSGNNGEPIFSIKPDGEFVPGPGVDPNKAISEAAKMFYEKMTVFGKSLAQTTKEQSLKIKELENEISKLKSENGTSN